MFTLYQNGVHYDAKKGLREPNFVPWMFAPAEGCRTGTVREDRWAEGQTADKPPEEIATPSRAPRSRSVPHDGDRTLSKVSPPPGGPRRPPEPYPMRKVGSDG